MFRIFVSVVSANMAAGWLEGVPPTDTCATLYWMVLARKHRPRNMPGERLTAGTVSTCMGLQPRHDVGVERRRPLRYQRWVDALMCARIPLYIPVTADCMFTRVFFPPSRVPG